MDDRVDFELYKSAICHKVKKMGDLDFLVDVLETEQITSLMQKGWTLEALYLLAMVDYLSRVNDIPLCEEYDALRLYKLKKPIYPLSAWLHYSLNRDTSRFKKYKHDAIPEFARHNIIESEIRNVV